MDLSSITIENFRVFGQGSDALVLPVRRGLTALVGENDSGKTAIIDALRYALGTTDQEWQRRVDADVHGEGTSHEIKIACKFEGLDNSDKRTFVEFLTFSDKSGADPVLYVNWTAKDTGEVRRGRPHRQVELHSGKDGDGPTIPPEVRDLLRATYLRIFKIRCANRRNAVAAGLLGACNASERASWLPDSNSGNRPAGSISRPRNLRHATAMRRYVSLAVTDVSTRLTIRCTGTRTSPPPSTLIAA